MQSDIENSAISDIKTPLAAKMLHKLNENSLWNYVNVPEKWSKTNTIATILQFITCKLDNFLLMCINVFNDFSMTDSESIGSDKQTQLAEQFLNLFSVLENNGFANAKDFHKRINFWCGKVAKVKALEKSTELSDNQIPAIAVMYDICSMIKKVRQDYNIAPLMSAISRVYASYAYDDVNVYLSSDKESETPGFTVPNNFWTTELPTLMALKHRGIISDIRIYLYDDEKARWNDGISLFSEEANQIPIRRRFAYPFDLQEKVTADRFLKGQMTDDDRKCFRESYPRPSITYGALKRITHEWRARTKHHKLAQQETAQQKAVAERDNVRVCEHQPLTRP